jgi:hypothetical protein
VEAQPARVRPVASFRFPVHRPDGTRGDDSDVINILDLDTIVLGGIYGPFAPALIAPLERELDRQVMGGRERAVRLRPATLGPDAVVRGAAAAIVQRVLDDPSAAVTV